jgi:hypothetical protein
VNSLLTGIRPSQPFDSSNISIKSPRFAGLRSSFRPPCGKSREMGSLSRFKAFLLSALPWRPFAILPYSFRRKIYEEGSCTPRGLFRWLRQGRTNLPCLALVKHSQSHFVTYFESSDELNKILAFAERSSITRHYDVSPNFFSRASGLHRFNQKTVKHRQANNLTNNSRQHGPKEVTPPRFTPCRAHRKRAGPRWPCPIRAH